MMRDLFWYEKDLFYRAFGLSGRRGPFILKSFFCFNQKAALIGAVVFLLDEIFGFLAGKGFDQFF